MSGEAKKQGAHEPNALRVRQLEAELQSVKAQLQETIERYETSTEEPPAVTDKRAEEELRESEERVKLSAEAGRIGNWQIDLTTDTLESSAICKANFGLAANEDLSFERFFELLHPDDRGRLRATIKKAVETRTDYDAEYRVVWSDSSVHWIFARGRAFYAADGTPLRMLGVTQNITERKQDEERLRKSEERFRSYFELGLIGMAITSPTKGFLEVNGEICKILGYERSELLQMNWAEMTHPDDVATDVANFNRVTAGEIDGYSMDKRWIRKDGQIIYSTISVKALRRADGSVDHFVALLEDITERKRSEQALRESEAKYHSLFDSIDEGFCLIETILDARGEPVDYRFLETNAAFDRQNEFTGVVGKTVLELVPDIEKHWLETYGRVARTGEAVRFENNVAPINRWFDIYAVRVGAGSPQIAVVFRDITERKRAEERLRTSEEWLRQATEAGQVFVWEIDLTAQTAKFSENVERVLGFPLPTSLEDNFAALHPEDRERQREIVERAIRAGGRFDEEHRISNPSGRSVWVRASGAVVVGADGRPVRLVGTTRNISERKQAEEALRQANDELERRVAERTQELTATLAALQAEEAARKELLHRIVFTQEDERRRIARDLHDQFGQGLTAMTLKLRRLKEGCGEHEELCGELEALEADARQLDRDVNFLVWELRPTALDDFGLQSALTKHARNWSKHFGVEVELHASGMERDRLTPEIETTLYRIAQEALNNIAKHARATTVGIILERNTDHVSLIIEDNGVGFNPDDISGRGNGGFGLTGMRERAALLGGTVIMELHPGNGVTAFVRVPAPPAP